MLAEELYSSLVLPMVHIQPEKYCLRHTSYLLKDVSSVMFLNSWSSKEIANAMEHISLIFAKLKSAGDTMLSQVDWIDEPMKQKFMTKLDNLQIVTDGAVNIWKNDSLLDARIRILENSTSYPDQIFSLMLRHRIFLYKLWGSSAQDTNNM